MTQEDPKEASTNDEIVDNGADNEEDEDVAAEDGSEPAAAAKKKKKKSEFFMSHICWVHAVVLCIVCTLIWQCASSVV